MAFVRVTFPNRSSSKWFVRGLAGALAFMAMVLATSCSGLREGDEPVERAQQSVGGCNDCLQWPPYCWSYVEETPGGYVLSPNYDRCAAAPCPLGDPTFDPSTLAPFADHIRFLWANLQQLPSAEFNCTNQCQGQGYSCVERECDSLCVLDKIDATRAGVLRGDVRGSTGTGLAGVSVSVVGDADYGNVLTEWGNFSDSVPYPPPPATGRYFIAVNAGAPIRLRFTKTGYLPAERVVDPIAGAYVTVPTVELVPEPATAGTVTSGAAGWTVVQGSPESDTAGSRRAKVFFPPGTTWTPSTSSLDVMLKEFTVGTTGPDKMPAALPPASAYTYAIELLGKNPSTGQSISPTFINAYGNAVVVYQDNYLNMPVGWVVPSGHYDPVAGAWKQHLDGIGPTAKPLNGKVVHIISIDGTGAALIDTTGDGVVDNAGIPLDERVALASQWSAGKKLWRVPVTHFSTCDFNFPYGLDPNAKPPKFGVDPGDNAREKPSCRPGSIVECEPQVLGEEIDLAGTPYSLVYRSGRVPGYRAAYTMDVRVDSGAALSAGATAIIVKGYFAGKSHPPQQTTPSAGTQTFTLTWDGTDAFGRLLNGPQPVTVEVGYVYPGQYKGTTSCSGAAGCTNHTTKTACEAASCTWSEPVFAVPPGASYATGNNTLQQITLWTVWKGTLGALDARTAGLGGWTLNVQHAYSHEAGTIFYGWGGQRSAKAMGATLTTIAGRKSGQTCTCPSSSGCVAGCIGTSLEGGMEFGPDGALYFTVRTDGVVKKVLDGTMTTVVTGLNQPQDVAVASDGTLYIAAAGNHTVYRWNGSLVAVAGTGSAGNGVEGLGTTVALNQPYAVEIGPDGALYIADTTNGKIRRLDGSGYLKTVAGTGAFGSGGDGFPATAPGAQLSSPRGIAFGPDGALYISQYSTASNARIRRVGSDGIISTYAGGGTDPADGARADLAKLNLPSKMSFGPDGVLYFADEGSFRIKRVAAGSKDGTLSAYVATIAGNGSAAPCTADGTSATASATPIATGVAVDAQGYVNYIDYSTCKNIRRIQPPLLGQVVAGEVVVPSEDGRELYVFDYRGLHLRTYDALVKDLSTGAAAILFEFIYQDYDSGRLVTAIRDRRGTTSATANVTTIARDSNGVPTSITAPSGKVTTLSVPSGYLTSVTRPDSLGAHTLVYDNGSGNGMGLLTQLTDPRGLPYNFSYTTSGPAGRLLTDRDYLTQTGAPFVSLNRSVLSDGWTRVEATSSKGIVTRHDQRPEPDGSLSRRVVSANGTTTLSSLASSGTSVVTLADGTLQSATPIPDQRFGMSAATSEVVRELPGTANKQLTVRTERTIDGLSGLQDFTKLTETRTTLPGGADPNLIRKTEYERTSTPHFIRTTTPAGRKLKRELDSYGRVEKIVYDTTLPATPEVAFVSFAYDSKGRPTQMTQGNRRTKYEYSTTGYPEYIKRGTVAPNLDLFTTRHVTDALGQVTEVFRNVLTTGNQAKLTYDGNSNLQTVLIPPSWAQHTVNPTLDGQLDYYQSPEGSATKTDESYDTDRRQIASVAPGLKGFFRYFDDPPPAGAGTGRLKETVSISSGSQLKLYGYDPANGNLTSIAANASAVTTSYNYYGAGIQTGWDGLLFQTGTSWLSSLKNVSYTYDGYLRRGTEAVSGGQTLTYGYDLDSLVNTVQAGALATFNLTDRSAQSGRLNKLYTGSTSTGVVTSYLYDPTYGQLTSATTKYPGTGGSTLYSLTLAYDSLGRITTKTENVQGSPTTTGYQYDTRGRLWKETPQGFADVVYLYDAAGNKNDNRTSTDYPTSYPPLGTAFADQSLTYGSGDKHSNAGYTYSNEGQRTAWTSGGVTYSYGWDDFSNLTTVTKTGGLSLEHTYDGRGRRVTRKKLNAPTQERRYLYDRQNRLVAVYDGSGSLLQQFVYTSGRHVPDGMIAGGTVYHLLSDHVGSVRLVVTTGGAVQQRIDYDAWGRITQDTNAGFQPFGFAGGIWDADAGLVLMGARWYDPVTGRFITRDPARFDGGFNLYAYVDNDPVNAIDPSGLGPMDLLRCIFSWPPKAPGACLAEEAERFSHGWAGDKKWGNGFSGASGGDGAPPPGGNGEFCDTGVYEACELVDSTPFACVYMCPISERYEHVYKRTFGPAGEGAVNDNMCPRFTPGDRIR